MIRRGLLPSLLFAVAVLLAARLAGQGEPAVTARPPVPTPTDTPADEPTVQPPPSEAFAAVAERPLFTPSRRPAPPAPSPPAMAPPPPPPPTLPAGLVLVGVAIEPQRRIALVRAAASPTAVAVEVGQTIGSFIVEDIQADGIVLRVGGHQHRLDFPKR